MVKIIVLIYKKNWIGNGIFWLFDIDAESEDFSCFFDGNFYFYPMVTEAWRRGGQVWGDGEQYRKKIQLFLLYLLHNSKIVRNFATEIKG